MTTKRGGGIKMRKNPGDEEFYKMKDKNKIWWVKNPFMVGIGEYSFDKKTIYSEEDYYNLPPNLKKIFDEEEPNIAVQISGISGRRDASPELIVAALKQIHDDDD